ncbi:spermine oxidase-like [Episyrphus balteatus]|uniref:spermine oxidase-like n=1 Tax=Episyrphus balteatus TaxID=286459 RepID=UPI0024858DD8|nr:spermine oxidase-like [Episyrphus balteatus]
MNTARIVIIGAGTSGIAAATKLLELGFQKVLVIEAENRIGGRIHTIPFGDNVIDLGAQWCHGEKDNIVFELANKHNLLESTGDVYQNYECIRSNGEILPEEVTQRLMGIVHEGLGTHKSDLKEYNGSLGSYISRFFFEELQRSENSDIDEKIAKEFFEFYEKFENSYESSDSLSDVSGKGYLEYWNCEGDLQLNWKDKGFTKLIQLLLNSEKMGNELGVLNKRVLLGTPVNQISWNNGKIEVNCGNNKIIEADHVIVTVSLGVLKEKHSKLFNPKLPIQKVRAIESIGFGTVNKIFIEFPEQFWPNDWNGFALLWRQEDLDEIRGTNRAWLEDIFGFYKVSYQPRILTGWAVGKTGRHIETLPEDELLSGCMYLLRKFLKWQVPTPVSIKPSTWFSNENFRGSYSYRSVMAEKEDTWASDLASPLKDSHQKPVVLFAGEATSDHYYSTVHGAVQTGWREAQRLADFYNNGAPKSQL